MAKDDEEIVEDEVEQLVLFAFNEYEWRLLDVKLSDLTPNNQIAAPAPAKSKIKDQKNGGTVNPITIRMANKAEGEEGKYYIIDGRDRTMIARLLEWPTIKANLVLKAGDTEALVATIRANHQHRANPAADAEILRKMQKAGIPLELSGLSRPQIVRAAAYAKSPKPFQTAVTRGLMSVATLEKIASLTAERQAPLLALARKGEKITAGMVAEAKRVQVGAQTQAVVQRLAIPADKMVPVSVLPFLIYSPKLRKPAGLLMDKVAARNKAVESPADGYRVYALTEV